MGKVSHKKTCTTLFVLYFLTVCRNKKASQHIRRKAKYNYHQTASRYNDQPLAE